MEQKRLRTYPSVFIYVVFMMCGFHRTLRRSIYIAVPLVVVVYFLLNLSFFAVLSVNEITEATAVALVCSHYKRLRITRSTGGVNVNNDMPVLSPLRCI